MKMKNNKKVGTIFIVLFIAFAVSGFISVETGWFFLPIIIWFAFFITMIVVAKNNIKNAKNDPKFKEMKDAFKRFYEENKTTSAQEEKDIFEEAVYEIWLESKVPEKLIANLTKREREVYHKIYIENKKPKEAAKELELSINAVNNIHKNLRDKIKDDVKRKNF